MELLAPAGNMACLKAAVNSGADAVYFAAKNFGARSFADNFTDRELEDAVAYCHLHGAKAYVTVNTMTLDKEFDALDGLVGTLAQAGVDAVIVQDLGVVRRIAQICPSLPIHASTQMTVHNLQGVLELEKLGVERVVLARELTETEIRFIKERCHAELEVFVHGAMCMSYSGQCLMSSVLGGRSGNRGKCAQPCRLPYHSGNGAEKFYMSLKDMSLIAHLDALRAMGVDSLKIEGRMKGEDYVSAVVETYRRCMDEERLPKKEEANRLNRVFYRGGLTDGYFADRKGADMFAFDKPDNPYRRNTDAEPTEHHERQAAVACEVRLREGEPPQITLSLGETTVTHIGAEPLAKAEKNPITAEGAEVQITKTGGTAFVFRPLAITIEGTPFVPMKVLNELRRVGIQKLESVILDKDRKTVTQIPLCKPKSVAAEMQLTASVRTLEQWEEVRKFPFVRIDVPLSLLAESAERFMQDLHRVVVVPPVIVSDTRMPTVKKRLDDLFAKGFRHLRAEHLWLAAEKERWILHGGHRLNVANSAAVAQLWESGFDTVCLSAELNLAQVRDIAKPLPTELLIYGHLPLMITENCVLKNMKRCPCDGVGEIADRKGKRFPVVKDDDICRSVILNSVPLYMADKLQELQQAGIACGRLLFTVESAERCRELCQQYQNGTVTDGAYTRLHFYKGVL